MFVVDRVVGEGDVGPRVEPQDKVGAGAGAATPSPSVFVSSSIKVAVASLALSWVGAILFAVFVFALCAVGWPKVGLGGRQSLRFGAALGGGCGKMLQPARHLCRPRGARQARFCHAAAFASVLQTLARLIFLVFERISGTLETRPKPVLQLRLPPLSLLAASAVCV